MDLGGWYPDPEGPRGRVRWWDGQAWTEHAADEGAPETAGPPGTVRIRKDHTVLRRRLRQLVVPVAGLAAVAALIAVPIAVSGSRPGERPYTGPSATADAPPLAQLCQGTSASKPGPPVGPSRAGARIVDPRAKLSYLRLGAPFLPWTGGTWGQNSGAGLGEEFTTGQYFVTETEPDGSPYMATILSGTVPSSFGDDPHPNIQCAARVIADDVRKSYYPQPNQRKDIEQKPVSVGGRPAYLMKFHLTFAEQGLSAKGELVAICVVDMPGRKASAIYISIPDSHRQYDSSIDTVVNSLQIAR